MCRQKSLGTRSVRCNTKPGARESLTSTEPQRPGLEFKVVGYLLDSAEGEVPGADGGKAAGGEGRRRAPADKPPGAGEEGSGPSWGAGLTGSVAFRHVAWERRGKGQPSQCRRWVRRPRTEPHPPGTRPPVSESLPRSLSSSHHTWRLPGPPRPRP